MSEDEPPIAPHPHHEAPAALPEGAGISTLGVALIGGAVAAAVGGMLLALPWVRRKTKPDAKPRATPQSRRPRRKKPTEQSS